MKLKVNESVPDDVNKGIVRIDSSFMKESKIKPGDIVALTGQRTTYAIVDRAYPGDIGLNIIRMDGITRRNAKTSIGEFISIKKAEIQEAKHITIAPATKGIMIRANPETLKSGLLGKVVLTGDIVAIGGTKQRTQFKSSSPLFDEIFKEIFNDFNTATFSDLKFVVAKTNPKKPVIITENTELELSAKAINIEENILPDVTYEDIGGLESEIKKVREMVELPLKHPEIFERLGIEPPKGVLLHGPPGTGKTLLAKAVATETNANFIVINGPEIMSKFYGESEANLRKKFEEAEKNAPSILFIDEIDAIATKREESRGDVEKRVVAQLLSIMDGLKSRGKVVVIAASNIPNALDPALRRPGRFDREIEIGVPNKEGRLIILKIHTRNMPLDEDVNLEDIAEIIHGFVGADVAALTKEAAMTLIRRVLADVELKEGEPLPDEILEQLKISKSDFKEALKVVRPSAMREVFVEVPDIKWDNIGGLIDVKQELKEAVEWPLKSPESFKRLGIKAPKGVLLYGAPGTGKTLLAKAVANESDSNFILVKGPELLSKWVGESEKAVREIFKKARQASPSIIFFDEIDAIAPRRSSSQDNKVTERVVNQMLTEMDGLEELHDVVVIAATNRPDIMDAALLRPGRFDRIILAKAPDKETRLKIFEVHTKNMPLATDVDLKVLSEKTENYVGADIESICREAAILALRENMDTKQIFQKHFVEAVKKVRPSLTKEIQEIYENLEQHFRQAKANEIKESKQYYFG